MERSRYPWISYNDANVSTVPTQQINPALAPNTSDFRYDRSQLRSFHQEQPIYQYPPTQIPLHQIQLNQQFANPTNYPVPYYGQRHVGQYPQSSSEHFQLRHQNVPTAYLDPNIVQYQPFIQYQPVYQSTCTNSVITSSNQAQTITTPSNQQEIPSIHVKPERNVDVKPGRNVDFFQRQVTKDQFQQPHSSRHISSQHPTVSEFKDENKAGLSAGGAMSELLFRGALEQAQYEKPALSKRRKQSFINELQNAVIHGYSGKLNQNEFYEAYSKKGPKSKTQKIPPIVGARVAAIVGEEQANPVEEQAPKPFVNIIENPPVVREHYINQDSLSRAFLSSYDTQIPKVTRTDQWEMRNNRQQDIQGILEINAPPKDNYVLDTNKEKQFYDPIKAQLQGGLETTFLSQVQSQQKDELAGFVQDQDQGQPYSGSLEKIQLPVADKNEGKDPVTETGLPSDEIISGNCHLLNALDMPDEELYSIERMFLDGLYQRNLAILTVNDADFFLEDENRKDPLNNSTNIANCCPKTGCSDKQDACCDGKNTLVGNCNEKGELFRIEGRNEILTCENLVNRPSFDKCEGKEDNVSRSERLLPNAQRVLAEETIKSTENKHVSDDINHVSPTPAFKTPYSFKNTEDDPPFELLRLLEDIPDEVVTNLELVFLQGVGDRSLTVLCIEDVETILNEMFPLINDKTCTTISNMDTPIAVGSLRRDPDISQFHISSNPCSCAPVSTTTTNSVTWSQMGIKQYILQRFAQDLAKYGSFYSESETDSQSAKTTEGSVDLYTLNYNTPREDVFEISPFQQTTEQFRLADLSKPDLVSHGPDNDGEIHHYSVSQNRLTYTENPLE